MAHFALTLVHGPGWDASREIRQQRRWDEHAAFMDGLVDDGFIIMGGPVDGTDRSLHVVEADDEGQVRNRLRGDPWAEMGLLDVGSIEQWSIWLDGRAGI